MEIIRKITRELAISGPISDSQWPEVVAEGFQAVLNLRSLDPQQHLLEQQQVENLGLHYAHFPITTEVMSPSIAAKVLTQIDELPKPTVICCGNALLAAAMALMYVATHQGETLQQAFSRAERLELF
jgi:protein tyrosine phosphatase (PTP) superfamily phosphohydrolase (DUF442 family)